MGRKKMNTKSTNTESQMASGSNAVGLLSYQAPLQYQAQMSLSVLGVVREQRFVANKSGA